MKFNKLSGDVNYQVYGGKFVSKRLNNSEFDYWLVMDVINMHEATGETDIPKYNVSIQAVSPEQAKGHIDSAFSSAGFSDEQLAQYENDSLIQVEVLSEYGIFAQLWNENGDNLNKLMQQAHKQAQLIEMLFGFYMDRIENGLGQNGWQLIRGQDIREFLGMK